MGKILDSSLILVAVMPRQQDFEIARIFGWYRIPLRMAPKIIDVDYLAFYQTSEFGADHKWRIEYVAPIYGHELTTRAELLRAEPDHPRANEEYYKIQIGSLEKLQDPIMAGNWKRVTFFYTLGSLLLNAKILNDLVVQSEDRSFLWKSLRERGLSQYLSTRPEQEVDLPEQELLKILTGLSTGQFDSDYLDI